MPGRDQLGPMQRIVRIMAVLETSGPGGIGAERLLRFAAYGDGDPRSQLARDLKHLRAQGWQIDNVAPSGEDARYRMVTGDNRLRLRLDAEQVAALQRAMILADRADLARRLSVEPGDLPEGVGTSVVAHGHPASDELARSLDAVRRRSRIRFSYKGTARVVHPASVRFRDGQWYLSGLEDGGDVLKHFVVGRMSGAVLDPPRTADPVAAARDIPLHPLQWEVDPPVEVVLRAAADYVPDVVRLLLAPDAERPAAGDGQGGGEGDVDLTYTVTHRAALRARLYALGRRVRVVAPDEVRQEMLAELRELVGA